MPSQRPEQDPKHEGEEEGPSLRITLSECGASRSDHSLAGEELLEYAEFLVSIGFGSEKVLDRIAAGTIRTCEELEEVVGFETTFRQREYLEVAYDLLCCEEFGSLNALCTAVASEFVSPSETADGEDARKVLAAAVHAAFVRAKVHEVDAPGNSRDRLKRVEAKIRERFE